MAKPTASIIERAWRLRREITNERFMFDMDKAKLLELHVHSWSGTDRSGQPLTVVWVAGPQTGALFSAYELSGSEPLSTDPEKGE